MAAGNHHREVNRLSHRDFSAKSYLTRASSRLKTTGQQERKPFYMPAFNQDGTTNKPINVRCLIPY
jgi:hypothetical protein